MSKTGRNLAAAVLLVCIGLCSVWLLRLRPTKILVVNPLPAQAAEMALNNDSRRIRVVCRPMEEAGRFERYDAVVLYGRGLYLDSLQLRSLEKAAGKGVPVFTNAVRNAGLSIDRNLDSLQIRTLRAYFSNPCGSNYRSLLHFLRQIATPRRSGARDYAPPVVLPPDMYYHLENGRYFDTAEELTDYLAQKGMYHPDGPRVVFLSGVSFPIENNRTHVDSLLSRLVRDGYNVYPLHASGSRREEMIKAADPDAIIFFPMGRLGNDDLVAWTSRENIPLFMPFPLIQSREAWLDAGNPVSGGTLNARIVVPEIDGGMTPLCIATQNPTADGYLLYTPEAERIDAFMEQFGRFMKLRTLPNRDKKVAVVYFKSPGKDALLASGMEVVPSLYNFLKRLRQEGYDVSGLPQTLDAFRRELMRKGRVIGSYAPAAQEQFMEEADPLWIAAEDYEAWARERLLPEKYAEVVKHYGKAPGTLLSRGDSLAVAAIRYGNILLFPQPRPALGEDDFRLVHGVDVPPPHAYIAPYLYMQREFDADALIHFGTHGNLEFTPGKNAALSQADWAEVLTGNRPHFYFYTTGNVGEAMIAKRRSHAVIVTHLTPPYVESGLRQQYASLMEDLHASLADPARNTVGLKEKIIRSGLHRDLSLDSVSAVPYTAEELEKVDSFVEELVNEKVTGACYVMGEAYSGKDMVSSVLAVCADKLAYSRAKADFEKGLLSRESLQDFDCIARRYLPAAKSDLTETLLGKTPLAADGREEALAVRRLLTESAGAEIESMVRALCGMPVRPAPGGDPVLNPNVLPMGRNMFSINAEATPGEKAWETGAKLADETLGTYFAQHGEYPRKVSYTFWAGEFISSQGATLAQALRMLGVEPVRDEQGRVMDLKLTPSEQLGRPRIDILVQVSGQLRDIAGSRLKMLTEAVALAAEATDDLYPNFVAEGTLQQERQLVRKGDSPRRARALSRMRVFGPVNSGYSTGMLHYTESSGSWDERQELVDGYLNNMCAMYGDEENWGSMDVNLFTAVIENTDVIVQPRQSNTWGPLSLDHVYEFTGALSLAASAISGKEPDALLADYRNPYLPRLQDTREAAAIEARATILNPVWIRERMKGDASTAQMFGEVFRNIFGWSALRKSMLSGDLYDSLYRIYIADGYGLEIERYFGEVNPAALQEMTATMLESARKGFWQADEAQLRETAELHARLTGTYGAPCTEFVCANGKLQSFTRSLLDEADARRYTDEMDKVLSHGKNAKVLKPETHGFEQTELSTPAAAVLAGIAVILSVLVLAVLLRKKKK